MERPVRICMMGGFSIRCGDELYDNLAAKSRKGVSLLQFLILEREKTMSGPRLIREMWSGRRAENPESALKTMVSRLRSLLRGIQPGLEAMIASTGGGYRYERIDGVSVDVTEIMDIFDRLRGHAPDAADEPLYDELLRLYTGDLYHTGDIVNGVTTVNWLHREYLEAVLGYIELLKRRESYNRICEVCRAALRIDDQDEQLHIELMQAMVNLNRAREAMEEYRKVIRGGREPSEFEPSEELKTAYASLAESGQSVRFNLDVIRNELEQIDADRRGPFFCDYRAFKEIYNIEIRNLERLGSTMFLSVIMLGDPGRTDVMNPVSRESGMAGLQEILRNNLRKGDIVTRFSDNIFAMLLPTVNYGTGGMVIERIEKLFHEAFPGGNIPFHARISPLGGRLQQAR